MLILGVDQSTKTGLASVELDTSVRVTHTMTLTFPKLRGFDRLAAFRDKIQPWLQDVSLVCFEGYGFASKSLEVSVSIGTVLRMAAYDRGIPQIAIPPTSLKKFITGSGNAPKDRIMLDVYKRWVFEGTNDECDAVGLAMFGAALMGYDHNLPKANTDAIQGYLKKNKGDFEQIIKK